MTHRSATIAGWLATLALTACHQPVPPATPSITGPDTVIVDSTCWFTVTSQDRDRVEFRIDWGDGDTTGFEQPAYQQCRPYLYRSHCWQRVGLAEVRAQARSQELLVSDWSDPWSTAVTAQPNRAPGQPSIPTGRDTGYIDTVYAFSTAGIDPDSDSLRYRLAWGDGDTSNWSAPVPPGVSVELTHAWDSAGVYAVRAQSRDPSGLESPWSDSTPVDLAPDCPFRVKARVFLWGSPSSVAVSPSGWFVYVTDGHDRLYLIESSGFLVYWIPLSANVSDYSDIEVRPDGAYVYVAGEDSLIVIEARHHQIVARIWFPDGVPTSLGIVPDGSHLYAGGWGDYQLYIVNTADHSVIDSLDFCWWPWRIVPTPDSKRMFVTNCNWGDTRSPGRASRGRGRPSVRKGDTWAFVIDTDTRSVVDSLLVGDSPRGNLAAAMAPDGNTIYIGGTRAVYAVRTHDLVCRDTVFLSRHRPWDMALTPDGRFLCVAADDWLVFIRTADMKAVGCHSLDDGWRAAIAASPDGSRFYVIGEQTGNLVVLER